MKSSKRSAKRHPKKGFGEHLQRLRQNNTDFRQAEAARRLNISRQELSYYEKDIRMPSDALLMNIAHLYHVATAELLETAYWPQLILLPLIALIEPEQLSRDLIEEIERGLKENERKVLTIYIKKLLRRRVAQNVK